MRTTWGAIAAAAILVLAWPPATAQHAEHRHDDRSHDAKSSHSFADVERWVKVFDDPARDAWQKPGEVLGFLGVSPGQVVADVGAGTGYFTVRLAEAVGPDGKVLAVDIEPSLVDHLRQRAADAGLSWVEAVQAAPDDPKLPGAGVDLVLIVDTWHHIDDRLRYLDKLAGALHEGGRVAVIDFREGELPVGPPPGHKLSRDEVVAEFAEAGWSLDGEYRDLPYQYVLVFRPRPS